MAKTYKNKNYLKKKYEELGSTRRVGRYFGVSNGTIVYWMQKFGLPRIPKLHLHFNNSGKGRLGELYVLNHPFFRKDVKDTEVIDDKNKADLIWRGNRVNIKTSHYSRPLFRVKVKRHRVTFYICLYFDDSISNLVPQEIWIIPARLCSHAGISPGFKGRGSKFDKFRLSLLRDKEFSAKEEKEYNKHFIKKYAKFLKKGGKTNGLSTCGKK